MTELEDDIRDVRNSANAVHEMIMHQAVPKDESICSELRQCMSTLYECVDITLLSCVACSDNTETLKGAKNKLHCI